MSDEFKIVEFSTGGRPVEIMDLEQISLTTANVVKVRDSFKMTPPAPSGVEATGTRRWDGARTVAQRHANGTIGARWRVTGATAQAALDNVAELLDKVRYAQRGRYIKWRPDNEPNATYFEIRGPGEWTPDYRWVEFSQLFNVYVDASWPVAPLAEMDRMDIADNFEVPRDAKLLFTNQIINPLSGTISTPWTADASSPGTLTVGVTGGPPTGFARYATIAAPASPGNRYYAITFDATPFRGKYLWLTGWVFKPSAWTLSGGSDFSFWMTDGTATFSTNMTGKASNSWVLAQVGPLLVSSSATLITARVYNGGAAATISYGGITVTETAGPVVPPAPFDGDSDKAKWNGLSYASTSGVYDRSTLNDYIYDTGAGTLVIGNGQLIPTSTAQKILYHASRGYQYGDCQVTLKFTTGASVATGVGVAVVFKRLGTDDRLFVQQETTGWSIYKKDAGVNTSLSTGANTIVANTTYWLRGRIEGNIVFAEFFTVPPTPTSTPAATLTHVLAGANVTKFGIGVKGQAGMDLQPTFGTDWRYDDFTVEPFTYRNHLLPDVLQLGQVPGQTGAPCLVNVQMTNWNGGGTAPVWAMVGWWAKPATFNRIWNGDIAFTTGWLGTGGHTAGTTTISQILTDAKFGTRSLQLVTPATINAGANFAVAGRFRKGVPYTFECWVRSASGTTVVQLAAGNGGDSGGETGGALSTTWTKRTFVWTPTADEDRADFTIRQTAATITTFVIDGAVVYEGSTPPTIDTQMEGRGGVPAVGIIEAESACTLTTFAVVSDTNYRLGAGIRVTTSGVGTASAEWMVDPSLMDASDFSSGEVDVEVWGRFEIAAAIVTPILTISARSESGTAFGAIRYSGEFSSTGKRPAQPSSGTSFRLIRLGTLTFAADKYKPVRWRLHLDAAWAASSSGVLGLDQLFLVPVDARAISGPTGKANDTSYPKFIQSTAETTRVLRSDGSGATAEPGSNPFPDIGMSRPLELPAGNAEIFCGMSTLVPDDPTSNTTSEVEDYTATVHLEVVPRVHLSRGS